MKMTPHQSKQHSTKFNGNRNIHKHHSDSSNSNSNGNGNGNRQHYYGNSTTTTMNRNQSSSLQKEPSSNSLSLLSSLTSSLSLTNNNDFQHNQQQQMTTTMMDPPSSSSYVDDRDMRSIAASSTANNSTASSTFSFVQSLLGSRGLFFEGYYDTHLNPTTMEEEDGYHNSSSKRGNGNGYNGKGSGSGRHHHRHRHHDKQQQKQQQKGDNNDEEDTFDRDYAEDNEGKDGYAEKIPRNDKVALRRKNGTLATVRESAAKFKVVGSNDPFSLFRDNSNNANIQISGSGGNNNNKNNHNHPHNNKSNNHSGKSSSKRQHHHHGGSGGNKGSDHHPHHNSSSRSRRKRSRSSPSSSSLSPMALTPFAKLTKAVRFILLLGIMGISSNWMSNSILDSMGKHTSGSGGGGGSSIRFNEGMGSSSTENRRSPPSSSYNNNINADDSAARMAIENFITRSGSDSNVGGGGVVGGLRGGIAMDGNGNAYGYGADGDIVTIESVAEDYDGNEGMGEVTEEMGRVGGISDNTQNGGNGYYIVEDGVSSSERVIFGPDGRVMNVGTLSDSQDYQDGNNEESRKSEEVVKEKSEVMKEVSERLRTSLSNNSFGLDDSKLKENPKFTVDEKNSWYNANKDAISNIYGAKLDDNNEGASTNNDGAGDNTRFFLLRNRLLPLYSEPIPTEENPTITRHPLYNSSSPQYQALNWLANVDPLSLMDSDPGVIQRYALTVLYFSTGGPPIVFDEKGNPSTSSEYASNGKGSHAGPWRNAVNFLTPGHECTWKAETRSGGAGGGIRRCDKENNVVELSIYNDLTGTIPSELGRLWALRALYMGRNHLHGTIPTELGSLHSLSSLSLQWNELTGTIPEEALGGLKSLRALQLEGNVGLYGKVERHGVLCQRRNNYQPPENNGNQTQPFRRGTLRMLTATCTPPVGGLVAARTDRLECDCCSECFGY